MEICTFTELSFYGKHSPALDMDTNHNDQIIGRYNDAYDWVIEYEFLLI